MVLLCSEASYRSRDGFMLFNFLKDWVGIILSYFSALPYSLEYKAHARGTAASVVYSVYHKYKLLHYEDIYLVLYIILDNIKVLLFDYDLQ